MARGDGRASLCAYTLVSAHACTRWKDAQPMSLFRLKATWASEFMRINYAHIRRAVTTDQDLLSLRSVSGGRGGEGRESAFRACRDTVENKGPRCSTVRHIPCSMRLNVGQRPRKQDSESSSYYSLFFFFFFLSFLFFFFFLLLVR